MPPKPRLTKEEMNEINGGISFGSKVFLFGGLISFIISVLGLGILVDSILPKKAEKEKKVDE